MSDFKRKLKEYGYAKKTGFTEIGFVLESLGMSQKAFLALKNINKVVEEIGYLNLSIFFQDHKAPCIIPKCSCYNAIDSSWFEGNLIATSPETLIATEFCTKSKKYIYINDLTWTDKPELARVVRANHLTRFVRCQDYYDRLTDMGYRIHPKIVEDFNILDILEIINGEANEETSGTIEADGIVA